MDYGTKRECLRPAGHDSCILALVGEESTLALRSLTARRLKSTRQLIPIHATESRAAANFHSKHVEAHAHAVRRLQGKASSYSGLQVQLIW